MTGIWRLGGHLGASVSALVDGQLDAESTERAWQHVSQCAPCRKQVEHEGWVKRQLAQISDAPRADQPSERFLGSLLDLDPATVQSAADAWAETDRLEERGRARRRAGIALVGAGSVSAAVFGLSTLAASPMGIGGTTPSPAASVGGARPSTTPTPGSAAPAVAVHGRLPGWTVGSRNGAIAHARPVGTRR
jgi:hypothetical protein